MRRLVAALGTTVFLGALAGSAQAGTLTTSTHPGAPDPAGNAVAEHHAPEPSGIAYLPSLLNLQPTPSATWVDSRLQVTLPRPGTYALDLNLHGRLWGTPRVNAIILARLWNVTTGSVLPNSTRVVDHIVDDNPGARPIGHRVTAPISELVTVNAPTTIRLQATRINQVGSTTIAEIRSDGGGYTSFRYERISP